MTARVLLRLHIEAVWNLTLSPIEEETHEVIVPPYLTPWSLYLASFAQEEVALWPATVAPDQRAELLVTAKQARERWEKTLQMRREVIFQAPRISPEQQAQTEQVARIFTADDMDLLNSMCAEEVPILTPQKAPYIGVVVDGRLVSVAHSSRQTPTACELGIDTLPEARRQGYAKAATILWTALVQQKGLLPIYSAFSENTASLHLAEATGYRPRIKGVYGPVPKAAE